MANEAGWDRGIRTVVGLLALWLAFFSEAIPGVLTWVAVLIGAVLVITGLVGFCPAYRVFGISTCRTRV